MTASEAWTNFYDYGNIFSFLLRGLDEMDACKAQEAFEDGFNGKNEELYKDDNIHIFYNAEEDLSFTLYDYYKEGTRARLE